MLAQRKVNRLGAGPVLPHGRVHVESLPATWPALLCSYRPVVCNAGGSRGAGPSSSGDEDVQESLVDMLQLELAKAKVKEDIKADLEQRKKNIEQIGKELTEEFEKKVELDKMRMELASNSALADTMAQFKELDDEIQGIRNQLQADQAELNAFEARSAAQRNDSLFFKQLYKGPDSKQEGEGGAAGEASTSGATSTSTLDKEAVQRLRSNITAPAAREVHSPLRLYVSSYLALVLLWVVGSDVVSGDPKPALDGLYALLAMGLGWNAWNERQALLAEGEDRGKQ